MSGEENFYFYNALSSFTADVAYVGAVRHLYDAGLGADEIQKRLTYPLSKEKIEKVIKEYETEKSKSASAYEFVQETDGYGRKSFRRIKRDGNGK